VFLHHPGLRCLLPPASRIDLFGLNSSENSTGLPGIRERLLEPATPQQSVPAHQDEIIAKLMERIGIVQRRQREAGSWIIDEDPLGEGDGWQDWPAFHRVATTHRGRIRFLVTPPGASAAAQARIRQVAEHEYRIMSRLANDRLLRPRDMVDSELGVGLVYPLDDRFERLDLWLADNAGSVSAENQIKLLREVAEAVSYAHGSRVVHRGLTPHAVYVRPLPDGEVRVLVGDWQSAGTVTGPALTGLSGSGVTGLMGAGDESAGGAGRASDMLRPGAVDVDRRLAGRSRRPRACGTATPTASGWTCSRSAPWPTTCWPDVPRPRTGPRSASGCTGRTAWTWPRTCRRCPRPSARWCWRPPGPRSPSGCRTCGPSSSAWRTRRPRWPNRTRK
jgi:hypothetical protein